MHIRFAAVACLWAVFHLVPVAQAYEELTMGSLTYRYSIENGEATLLTCLDENGETYLSVPDTLGGCPVTVIGDNAFCRYSYPYRDRMHDRTVAIPSTVRRIGKSAFEDCQSIVEVRLNEGLVSMLLNLGQIKTECYILFYLTHTILAEKVMALVVDLYVLLVMR